MRAGIYIKDNRNRERGVFSSRTFEPGQYILHFTGERVAAGDIVDFTHCIQVTLEYFLSPSGKADDYVNHSCDPNSAVYLEEGCLVLRALKRIRKDREIVFDYGTILFSEPTTFHCHCGSRRCRGIIGNFYSMLPELQHYYRSGNMVPLLSGDAPLSVNGLLAGSMA